MDFGENPLSDTSGKKYNIKQMFYKDKDLDTAVLEIKNPDNNLPPGLKLRRADSAQLDLRYASLIGFGHPQSRTNTKTFEHCCRIVNPSSDEMWSALEWLSSMAQVYRHDLFVQGKDPMEVDRGYKNYDAGFKILFHCFMEHGSSGGPIIRVCHGSQDDAKSVEVIGIVTHAMPELFFQLTPNCQRYFPENRRFEAGTKTSYIYEKMKRDNSDVAEFADHLFNVEPMDES